MSNLVQMPEKTETEISREQEAQEIKSRKSEATFHWKQVTQAAMLQSRNSLRIGFHALAIKDKGLWGMLGFRDENEAREAADVSESGWFANIRLAEHYRGVAEELFVTMKQANAKAACDVPLSVRVSPEWLEAASKESIKVFAKRVDEEMTGKARPSGTVEPNVPFKASMPASQRRAVTQGIKEYAERVGIDPADTGTVLETMVAEQRGGVSLIEAITNAIQRIKEVKVVTHSGVSSDEALVKVEEVLDQMAIDFAAALQNASQAEEAA